MDTTSWQGLALGQAGLLSREQLRELGATRAFVRHQLDSERWVRRTRNVVSTTTGPPSRAQRFWLGVLHAGPSALIGGLSAAELHGLSGWEREAITVLVDDQLAFDRVPGYRFVRCRRDLVALRSAKTLPVARVGPAVLLFSAYWPQRRTAHGAIAAVVQQRLTTPDRLREDMATLRPIRGAAGFRSLLDDLDGGADLIAEIDVAGACRHAGLVLPDRRRRRRDREGRNR